MPSKTTQVLAGTEAEVQDGLKQQADAKKKKEEQEMLKKEQAEQEKAIKEELTAIAAAQKEEREKRKIVPKKLYIPQSGHYLALAPEPMGDERVYVTWYQDGVPRSSVYYQMTCWFGPAVKNGAEFVSIEPLDSTIIFVACEFIEERYKSVPFLSAMHLQNLNLARDKKQQILVQINDNFHFGQFGFTKIMKPVWRWLVYHPPFTKKGERIIFQHRFVENHLKSFFKTLAGAVSNISVTTAVGADAGATATISGAIKTLAPPLMDAVSAKSGHELQKFLPPPANSSALQQINKPSEISNSDLHNLEVVNIEEAKNELRAETSVAQAVNELQSGSGGNTEGTIEKVAQLKRIEEGKAVEITPPPFIRRKHARSRLERIRELKAINSNNNRQGSHGAAGFHTQPPESEGS